MSAQIKSELLETLQAKVSQDAYVLYEALSLCLSNSTTDDSLPIMIEHIIGYVHQIETCASVANLLGLEKICELTQQNLSVLEKHQPAFAQIERWPRLVSNYLYAPDNPVHAEQLIVWLQHTDWQMPLADDTAHQLITLLIQDTTELTFSSSTISQLSNRSDEENTMASHNRFHQLTPETPSQKDGASLSSQDHESNEDFITVESMESLDATQANSSDLLDDGAFEILAEGENPIPVFDDDAVDSVQVSMSTVEDEQFDNEDLLSDESFGILAEDQSLVSFTDEEIDPIPLVDSVPSVPNDLEVNDPSSQDEFELSAFDNLADVEYPSLYVNEPINAVDSHLSVEEDANDESSLDLDGLISLANDDSLNEQLLDEASFDLVDDESSDIAPVILESISVTEHLVEPNDILPVVPLSDVPQQEIENLLDESLFDSSHEHQSDEDENFEVELPVVDAEDELDDEAELIEELPLTSLEDSVLALQAATEEFPSDIRENTSREKEETQQQEEKPEEIEILTNKVVELSENLTNALNIFVTEENDTEVFLESIEQYTNALQILWEAAEKCQLSGLQSVCSFVSDNVFELSNLSQSERFARHELFALCPQLILDYLHDATEGSSQLVALLQNPQWINPLTSQLANDLKITLRQEAEAILQPTEFSDQLNEFEIKSSPQDTEHALAKIDAQPIASSPTQVTYQESDFTNDMWLAFDDVFGHQTDEQEESLTHAELSKEPEQVESSINPSISFPSVTWECRLDRVAVIKDATHPRMYSQATLGNKKEEIEDTIQATATNESSIETIERESIDPEAIIDSDAEIAAARKLTETHTINDNDIELITPEILDLLDAEISDAINDLTKALNRFTTAADNSTELLEAVEQYTDNVRSIANEAEMTNLRGLKEVCEIVNENIFELSTHAHAIRRNAYAHIEKWPHLVLYYLHDPIHSARDLIEHLTAPAWFIPLSQERAEALLYTLTQGKLGKEQPIIAAKEIERERLLKSPEIASATLEQEADDIIELPVEQFAEADITEDTLPYDHEDREPDIILAAPETLELVIAQVEESQEELARIFNELVLNDEVLTAIESYTEQVQAIWDTADMAGLVGLQEVCSFVNENIMLLGGENQKGRDSARDVFETWTFFVLTYLRSPSTGAHELVSHLQASHWLRPLSIEQADALKQQLLMQAVTSEESHHDVAEPINETQVDEIIDEIMLAPPESVDLLVGQISDVGEELNQALDRLIQADEGSEELLTEVEHYTDNVQAIWDAADMIGLVGVQDVCTFVNDNITMLSASDKDRQIAARPVFSTWHASVLTYLQAPRLGAIELINLLQDERWVAPLEDSQANTLRERLLLSPAHISFIDNLPEDSPKVSTTVDVDIESNIVLADPDVLALIMGQVGDIAGELSATLTQLVKCEDGSEDLLTAVETYTENVQVVWDAADMAGLVGLQDVCTFINDNVMLLSAGEQATRQAAREVFDEWTRFVLAYLSNPATGAIDLVKHLQQAQWFSPLTDELATTLQQRLLKSQASTVEPPVYLADPDVLAVVSSQITDVIDGLSEALKVCVSMENDNPALLEAIENYTNSVQAIWDTAEMAGLQGLQEVCTFVNDNLMTLSTQDATGKQAAQACFIQWPQAVLAYLQSPLSGATDLVALLQNPHWPTPLEDEQAATLLPLLTQSSQAPEQVAAFEAQVAQEESTAMQEEEPDEPAEPLAELEVEEGGQEISLGSAEVLEILTSELESSKEDLTSELNRFTTLSNQDPNFAEAAENYGDIVMRLHAAAEMLGLEGLQAVTTFIVDNVKGLAKQDLSVRTKAKKVLEAWPDLVLAYLNAPMAGVIPMLNHFRESGWATPLADERAHELLGLLTQSASTEEGIEESAAYARQTVASPEDVVLTLPDDINQDLFDAYLQETPQHASDFSQLVQSIIADPRIADIERAQRIAHTLKGSSNIIGIRGIANMGHHLEDILEYLAKNQVKPPKELTDVMVEAADCIEMMVDSLTGQGDAPDNAQQILQTILDWANRIDKGNLDAPPAPRSAPTAAKSSSSADDSGEKAEAKPKKEGGATASGTPEQVLRVPTKTVDDLMRLVGELSISLGQIQERLKHVLANTRVLNEQNLVLQKKTFELENLVDVRGITGIEKRDSSQLADEETLEFDALEFEEYNELHSVAHSFIESIADNRELGTSIRSDLLELEGMVIQQERLNKEFQATIMTTRMVPVSTMFSKLQRNVRQTCRATGKQAELVVEGTDILMDSDVLNNLADPLQHIIRNSIDHGLEMPDERALLGKPESGTVTLRFYREGNNIVVSCQDDGQGLNYTNIRYTAIQRGLLTEAQEVTEAELARLILMSGFSTKSGVTQMSGRGVGMDVVHTNIRQMKGTLDILSETGKGTNMVIKLPMTLVTMHVLIVRVGQFRYGIPTNTLEQALAHGTGELQRIGNEISFKMGKHIYPVKLLANLLNITGDTNEIRLDDQRPLILVREETGIIAVVVDELIDTHDLVMKSMGQYVKKVRGVSGASILGDGTLVALLDLPELLRSPMQAMMSAYGDGQGEGTTGAVVGGVPHVLIVDDSLSVRKSLSILVEDAGFEALLAKDGLEAIEVMGQTRPNVILVDMEMPRMNGLEFTAHVRANKATEKLPIFMITSRTTEKHREQAKTAGVSAYLTKPYQDTELLDLIDKGLAGKI